MITGCGDGVVRCFDAKSGHLLRTYSGRDGAILMQVGEWTGSSGVEPPEVLPPGQKHHSSELSHNALSCLLQDRAEAAQRQLR